MAIYVLFHLIFFKAFDWEVDQVTNWEAVYRLTHNENQNK